MIRKSAVLMAVMLIFAFVLPAFADDNSDDYITTGQVEKKDINDTLNTGGVDKVLKPTPVDTPTAVPKPKPKPKPKPTPKPKPKPRPKPKARPRPMPTYTPTEEPTPTATPVVPPDFNIADVTAEEVVKDKNMGNWFGLFDMIYNVKKLNVHMLVANKASAGGAMNVNAELVSSDQGVRIQNPLKDLQNMLSGESREMNFVVETTKDYKGPEKLPLSLKIKADYFERDYPVDVEITKYNWSLVVIIILLALIVILLIAIAVKR